MRVIIYHFCPFPVSDHGQRGPGDAQGAHALYLDRPRRNAHLLTGVLHHSHRGLPLHETGTDRNLELLPQEMTNTCTLREQ